MSIFIADDFYIYIAWMHECVRIDILGLNRLCDLQTVKPSDVVIMIAELLCDA